MHWWKGNVKIYFKETTKDCVNLIGINQGRNTPGGLLYRRQWNFFHMCVTLLDSVAPCTFLRDILLNEGSFVCLCLFVCFVFVCFCSFVRSFVVLFVCFFLPLPTGQPCFTGIKSLFLPFSGLLGSVGWLSNDVAGQRIPLKTGPIGCPETSVLKPTYAA
jgi:hypothetical protein